MRAVAWAPRGDLFAAGGFDGKVAIWRADGSAAGVLAEQTSVIFSVAFSSIGGRLATVSADDRVRLWKMDGTPIGELPAEKPQVAMTAKLMPTDRTSQPPTAPVGCAVGGSAARSHRRTSLPTAAACSRSPFSRATTCSPSGGRPDGAALEPRWQQSEIGPRSTATSTRSPSRPTQGTAGSGNAGRIQPQSRRTARTGVMRACQEMIFGTVLSPARSGDRAVDWGTVKSTALDPFEPRPVLEAGKAARGLALDDGRLISGGLDGVLRLWSPDGKELETEHVGLPIQRIGLHPGGMWVSANGNTVLFLDRARNLRGTAIALPEAMSSSRRRLVRGSEGVERFVRMVSDEGRPLMSGAVAARSEPDEVRARLTKE